MTEVMAELRGGERIMGGGERERAHYERERDGKGDRRYIVGG